MIRHFVDSSPSLFAYDESDGTCCWLVRLWLKILESLVHNQSPARFSRPPPQRMRARQPTREGLRRDTSWTHLFNLLIRSRTSPRAAGTMPALRPRLARIAYCPKTAPHWPIRFATRNPQVIELRQPPALEKLLVTRTR